MRRTSWISAVAITAAVLAGCSSGSSVDNPAPAPAGTTTTTRPPFAGGINGPVIPSTSGLLGH